jgi:SAM-dependent methyltransferase
MVERVADAAIRAMGWLRRNQSVAAEPGARINLGSVPTHVAPGWLNIDASAHVLLAWLPSPVLRLVLSRTDAGSPSASRLKSEKFVFHDLRYGIPLADGVASAVYSSHTLEHLSERVSKLVVSEAHRVLSPGGILRLVVPYVEKGEVDVHAETPRYLDRHRSHYTVESLRELLEAAGFHSVTARDFKVGECPDVSLLDNRPRSLFVEGRA